MLYTNNEYTDMVLLYGQCDFSANAARLQYSVQFPNRRLPNVQTFINVVLRLRETGQLQPKMEDRGPQRDFAHEDEILERIENNPSVSTREISNTLNTSHMAVWRILHHNLLYPFHLTKVQELIPADYPPRVEFCEWLTNQNAVDNQLINKIMWTDEACFSRQGIQNYHNNHIWSYENPHSIQQRRFQHKFSLNVWAAIIGDVLLGPYFIPNRLNGNSYLQHLQDIIPDVVPLQLRRSFIFMHDGAPPHFSRNVRNWLNTTIPGRWIGRQGPINWPARSPDLNMMDFFFWGYVKSLVYIDEIEDLANLRLRIENAFERVRQNLNNFNSVRQSLLRRTAACMESEGGHFEQNL